MLRVNVIPFIHRLHPSVIIFERYANPDSAQSTADPNAPIRLDIPSARNPGMIASLRYRLDERSGFVRAHGWWLYVSTPVGLACYPEVRELLASAQDAGLHKVLERLEDLRLVAFVAYCKVTEQVFFGRGLDGFCSLFFGGHGARLIVSDDRLEVARRQGKVRLSAADEKEWCEHAHLSPEGSFFEGVRRCFAGVRYCSRVDECDMPHRHLMASQADPLNLADSVQLLHEGLLHAFSSYGDRRIALRLSGGVDSRVLLVGLLEAVKRGILRMEQILCVSVLYPGLDCDESEEIRAITRIANVEWVGIVATPENVEAAYNECLTLPAPPFPTSFMGTLCMQEAKTRGAQIMLSGHGGDEIFHFDLVDVLANPLWARLKAIPMIRKFRQVCTVADECKALACALLGRRSLRSTGRLLQTHGLESHALQANRLARRISLAQGTGYEMSAYDTARQGLLLDVPLLRGSFFSRFDPAGLAITNGDAYKGVAFSYMNTYLRKIAEVAARKVTFGSMLHSHFPPTRGKCDPFDDTISRKYATSGTSSDWRAAHSSIGNSTHGNHKRRG